MVENQGEIFKKYLDESKIGVTECAKSLGVSRQTIYQYFKTKTFDTDTWKKITGVFPGLSSVFSSQSVDDLLQKIKKLEATLEERNEENRALYKELLATKNQLLDKSLSPDKNIVDDKL